jgi:hypothetical protein
MKNTIQKAVFVRLRNKRKEELPLVIEITDEPGSKRGMARKVTLRIVSAPVPVMFDHGARAYKAANVPGAHCVPMMSWAVSDPQTLVCTRGDLKRSDTYPFFVYVNGDETKKGRFIFGAYDLGYDRLERRWGRPVWARARELWSWEYSS